MAMEELRNKSNNISEKRGRNPCWSLEGFLAIFIVVFVVLEQGHFACYAYLVECD